MVVIKNLGGLVEAHDFPLHHDGVEGRHELADGRITGPDTDVLNRRLLATDTQPTKVASRSCEGLRSQLPQSGRFRRSSIAPDWQVGDVVQDIRDKLCNLKPDLTVLNRKGIVGNHPVERKRLCTNHPEIVT